MQAAMEAIHRKDSSEVPCQPKNPRDSFFKDLKVERMVLDRLKWIESAACASPFEFIDARAPVLLVAPSPNAGGCGERSVTVSFGRTRANSR